MKFRYNNSCTIKLNHFYLKYSMYDTYSDEYGFIDFRRSQHGSGMSQKSQAKCYVAELDRIAKENDSALFNVTQLKDIAKV